MEKYEELKRLLGQNSKIPYPTIPSLPKNERYAKIIYDNFAGEYGELTTITEYIYEHIELSESNKNISKIISDIIIQEMKHLNILGKIILTLGGNPLYISSKGEHWSGKNVKYDIKDLKKIIERNIILEDVAINNYRKLIRFTNNTQLRKIYERIIIDEKMHKTIFKKIEENNK